MTIAQFIWKQIIPTSIFVLADQYVENLLETNKLDTQKLSTISLGSQAVYISNRVDTNIIIQKLETALESYQGENKQDYKLLELLIAYKKLKGYSQSYIKNIITAIGNTTTSKEELLELIIENDEYHTSPIQDLNFEDEDLESIQNLLNQKCQQLNFEYLPVFDFEDFGLTQILVRK